MLKRLLIVCLVLYAGGSPVLSAPATGETARDRYLKADAAYQKLRNDSQKKMVRQYWMECIRLYQDVYRQEPDGSWAAAGMFRSGELYRELYSISRKSGDLKEAVDTFERVIKRYPDSAYRGRAENALKQTPSSGSSPPVKESASKSNPVQANPEPAVAAASPTPPVETAPQPSGPDAIGDLITDEGNAGGKTDEAQESRPSGPSVISNLRHWSNPNYTRVVIDVDSEATYTYRLLNQDPSINVPQRLYVDLDNSRLGNDTSKIVPINDNLLENIRTGQYTADRVRVVIDIKSFKTYKIFSLNNPFRIVIDVWGSDASSTRAQESSSTPGSYIEGGASANDRIPPSAIARQLALGVRTIVIDPGHGGKDYGAPGYMKGVHEKMVILEIARKLARKIEKELGCRIVLTRDNDRFLTLEERTAIANTNNADLFISLHTNAHRDSNAHGLETYFLNLATDEDSIRVAAMENATSTKNISDLQAILLDLMQNAKINESSRLASHVQSTMVSRLKRSYRPINNKGVKQAPFYVLLGAQMPAILVETGFISSPVECRRLVSPEYQDHLCNAILEGIRTYIKETNPSAFTRQEVNSDTRG